MRVVYRLLINWGPESVAVVLCDVVRNIISNECRGWIISGSIAFSQAALFCYFDYFAVRSSLRSSLRSSFSVAVLGDSGARDSILPSVKCPTQAL